VSLCAPPLAFELLLRLAMEAMLQPLRANGSLASPNEEAAAVACLAA
jgi:hypothetical protein